MKNNDYTLHNIANITNNNQQKDKKPAIEMTKTLLSKFCELNLKFINYEKHNASQLERYYFECKCQMFIKTHIIRAKEFMPQHINELKEDLMKRNPR